MWEKIVQSTLTIILITAAVEANDYTLEIQNDGPVVSGGVISFTGKLYEGNQLASGKFRFDWTDDSIARHSGSVETDSPVFNWTVQYTSKKDFPPGPYIMQVTAFKGYLLFPWRITSKRIMFHLTETLNGNLSLYQSNTEIEKQFVSNTTTVMHEISIKPSDMAYLNSTAVSVLTYWFIDCQFYGITDDFKFFKNYTEPDKEYVLDAIVLADFDPFPTPPPPTTTTTTTTPAPPPPPPPTTTTTPAPPPPPPPNPNQPALNTTAVPIDKLNNTIKPNVVQTNVAGKQKRSVVSNLNSETIVAKVHGKIMSINGSILYNDTFPFMCNNRTIIPLGPNSTYGYFSRKIVIKQPISKVIVTGNNWIKNGEMLQLSGSCVGSSSYTYCTEFVEGSYNVTGNETCSSGAIALDKCEFNINRLLIMKGEHTVITIISNDVSKNVSSWKVTVYKETKQTQLSIIVVPVSFSLVAVVLIVFGVAYYFQNRTRFTVEVADFNFGRQYADMEYKTFTERLKDSVTNAFTRAPIPGSAEAPVWPPGHKYGSMT